MDDREDNAAPDTTDEPAPAPTSPRRLERAPGERYGPRPTVAGEPTADTAAPAGSIARAAGFAAPAAVVALIVYVVFAGPLAFSAGLVIIGIFAGRMIGLTAKAGGGREVASDARIVVALLITLIWFVAAQLATWLYARNEGGVLSILDYLLQTFGPVVPLVAIASVLAAWWSAR
jgi:hypothetical protein